MGLKRHVERRFGDAAGVVRDRGRRDCRDHLKEMVLAEAGREESINVLVARRPRFSIIVFARAGAWSIARAWRRPGRRMTSPMPNFGGDTSSRLLALRRET
jgi:hypothetical protein